MKVLGKSIIVRRGETFVLSRKVFQDTLTLAQEWLCNALAACSTISRMPIEIHFRVFAEFHIP